ncbi:MAG: zinc ribbon domain-containing protein [Coriobacteriales bacterium]|nr:zinc ribbon domain-containing protein [Coriobacteriales bacterium]
MFCPNCGAQIPDGSRFCINCGAQLQVTQVQPPVQPQVQQQAPVGGAYPPPHQGQHGAHQAPQPPKKKNKLWLIIALILAAVLLLGAGIAAIVIWGRGGDPTPTPAPVVTGDPGSNPVDGPGTIQQPAPGNKYIYLPVSAVEETSFKDASGVVQYQDKYNYDILRGSDLRVMRWTSTSPDWSGKQIKEYTYNADGTVDRYVTQVDFDSGSNRIERTYKYDEQGRTSRSYTTYNAGTSDEYTNEVYYSYDADGNLQVITTYYPGWSYQQAFTYDSQNRLYQGGELGESPDMYWKYDSVGLNYYYGPNGKSNDEIEVTLTRGTDGVVNGSKGTVYYMGDSDTFSTIYGAVGADGTSTATASSTGYYRNCKATATYDDAGNIVEYSVVKTTADGGELTVRYTIAYQQYEVPESMVVSKQLIYLVAEPSYDTQLFEANIYDPGWQHAGKVELPFAFDPHLPYFDNEFAG